MATHDAALVTHAAAIAAAGRGRAPTAPTPTALPLNAAWGTFVVQILAKLTADHYHIMATCRMPQTGLANHTRNMIWSALSMRQVGYSLESMLNLKFDVN